jgi:hypothetical protein
VKSRLLASVVVGAALVLGTSGCAFISPQATTIPYSPADGIDVQDNGAPLLIRNALIIANPSGTIGNLVAAVVNTTGEPQVLTVQVGDGGITRTVPVRANAVKSLGDNAEHTAPLRISGLDAKPGSTIQISFQSGDASPVVVAVPVLNNGQHYYNGLVPTPIRTPSATPTPIATPTP